MATKVGIPSPLDAFTSGVNAFDDLANTIANPPADRPLKGAIGRAGQQYCNYLGRVPGAASGLLGPGLAAGSLLCKPYWDNNGYDAPVAGSPPFTGGQCPVTYIMEVQRPNGGTWVAADPSTAPGPITGFSVQNMGPGPSGTTQWRGTFTYAGGSSVRQLNHSEGGIGLRPRVRRSDAQPDNCGDLPAPLVPGPNPPPTPAPFAPGLEPGVDPDGQPFFYVPPIPPEVPGADPVDPPDPTGGFGGDGGGGDAPPGGPTGEDGGTGNGGDEDFGEPPEGERWVGCCITITTEPPGLGIIPASLPESIYPEILGNVRLAFDGGGGVGYDTPIQIRQKTTCVWEPVRGMAPTGCRVNVKPGTSYSIRKFSVPEED